MDDAPAPISIEAPADEPGTEAPAEEEE